MDQYEDLKNFTEKTQLKSLRFVDFTKQNREVNHGQWSIVSQLAGKPQHLGEPPSSVIPAENHSAHLNAFQQNAIPEPSAGSSLTLNALHALREQPQPVFAATGQGSRSPLFQEMSQNAPHSQAVPSVQSVPPVSKSLFEMPTKTAQAPFAETMPDPAPTASHSHVQMAITETLFQSPGNEARTTRSPLFSHMQRSNEPAPTSDMPKRPIGQANRSKPAETSSLILSTTPNAKSGINTTQTQAAVNAGVFSHLFVQKDNDIHHQGKETLLQPLLKRIATCR